LNRASMPEGPAAARARALGLDAIHRIAPLRRALMHLGLGTR
jgi:2-octaprenyl-6-methoxyphenol hydroxylase